MSKINNKKIEELRQLTHQVCSIEIAKKLKKLLPLRYRYMPYWFYSKKDKDIYMLEWQGLYEDVDKRKTIPAFSVGELGRLLLDHSKETIDIRLYSYGRGYISLRDNENIYFEFRYNQSDGSHDNEADARAKMLIYLIKNKKYA